MPYTAPTTLAEVYNDRHFREAFQSFAEGRQASENVNFHDDVLAYKDMVRKGVPDKELRAAAKHIFDTYAPKSKETEQPSPSMTPPQQGVGPQRKLDLNNLGNDDFGFSPQERPSASMEINLTGPVHQNLVANMKNINSAGRDSLATLFDQADAEVTNLLTNDVLGTFMVSDEYQTLDTRFKNAEAGRIRAEKNQAANAKQIRDENMALYGGDRWLQREVNQTKQDRLMVNQDIAKLQKQEDVFRNKARNLESNPSWGQKFRALFTPGGMQELVKRELAKADQLKFKAEGLEAEMQKQERETEKALKEKQEEMAAKGLSQGQGTHHSVREEMGEEQTHSHGQQQGLQNDHRMEGAQNRGLHGKVGDLVHPHNQDKGKGESVHHGQGPH